MPIAKQIFMIAKDGCIEYPGAKVVGIHLVVGKDSGFIGDSIKLYFDCLAQGSCCEGANITIRPVEPMLSCKECGLLFPRNLGTYRCPACGGQGAPTQIGKECYVDSIDLDVFALGQEEEDA